VSRQRERQVEGAQQSWRGSHHIARDVILREAQHCGYGIHRRDSDFIETYVGSPRRVAVRYDGSFWKAEDAESGEAIPMPAIQASDGLAEQVEPDRAGPGRARRGTHNGVRPSASGPSTGPPLPAGNLPRPPRLAPPDCKD